MTADPSGPVDLHDFVARHSVVTIDHGVACCYCGATPPSHVWHLLEELQKEVLAEVSDKT